MTYEHKLINEKRSFTEYSVSSPTQSFAIGFELYEDEQNIHLTLNNIPIADLGYTFEVINSLTVEVTPAIPSGVLRIQRETDIDENKHKFSAGAIFNALSMDENFEQIRQSQQEVRDGFGNLTTRVVPLVDGLEEALDQAAAASQAAQEAAEAAEEAAQVTRSASQVIDDSGLSQQQWNNGAESIADLLTTPNPKNGSRVYVKSYHSGLGKGGGVFIYDESKSSVNDGVITFNGWVRQYEIITSTMAGCKVDGVTNDREALQRGIDVTSARNIPLYLDEGIHLMADATFERWGTENPYQARCYIIDLRNNTYVKGLSENSVIKYGDGIVYTGYNESGYKGAQLFCPSQLVPISNITLEGFTVDGNGYNNKNRVLNPAGNTSNSQALVLALGRKARVKDCVFKDMPGCQVIYSRDNFKDVVISGNTFIDSGWLDGTNWLPDYTDQSTIFLSGTYKCYNNQLIQNYAGMFAGTAFELHGKGDITGNTVVGYANAFLSVGMYYDAHNRIIGNGVYDCNSLAYTDTHNVSFKNTMEVLSNTFFQRTSYISESLFFGRLRAIIGITGFNTTEGAKVIVKGNSITVDGVYDQRTPENLAKYNSVVYSQVPKHIEFSENTVIGVRGSIFRFGLQLISEDTSVVHVNNTYIDCGIPSSSHLGNSLFYSDNDGKLDYGVKLKSLYSANNTYKNCHFKRILTAGVEAAGLLFPEKFESSNEVFIGILPYAVGSVTGDATSTSSFLFDVKSINPVGNSTVIEENPHDAFKCYNQWGKFTVLKDKAMPVVYVKTGTQQNWSVQV